jgi:hypothetical protein
VIQIPKYIELTTEVTLAKIRGDMLRRSKFEKCYTEEVNPRGASEDHVVHNKKSPSQVLDTIITGIASTSCSSIWWLRRSALNFSGTDLPGDVISYRRSPRTNKRTDATRGGTINSKKIVGKYEDADAS